MKEVLDGIGGVIQMLWVIFKGFWIDLTADLLDFKTIIGIAVAVIVGLAGIIHIISRGRPPKI